MTNTRNLNLPTWDEGSTQPYLAFNQLLAASDTLIQPRVEGITAAPPGSPSVGQAWIVDVSPTGAWVGHAGDIAVAVTGGWTYFTPLDGWQAWVSNLTAQYQYSGTAWAPLPGGGGSGVDSLNSLTGALTLAPGSNITLTPSGGNTITIDAAGGGGGSGALPWFFFEDYGGDPTGVTDSTTAVQGAINAAAAAGGGVCGSKQVNATFLIGGALQDTSRGNAQIIMPALHAVNDPSMTIAIVGYIDPTPVFSVIGATPLPTTGLVFKSTLTSGTGSVFGGWGPSGSFVNLTNLTLELRNLTVKTVANPTLTAVDASHVCCLNARNVVIFTGSYSVAGITTPTTTTSFGLRTPGNGNGAYTAVNDVTVVGFYNAYEISEHCTGNNVNLFGCIRGLVFTSADHASCIDLVTCQHVATPIVGPSSGTHYISIAQLDLEHASSGAFMTTVDLSDTGNRLFGKINWYSVAAGTPGPSHVFTNSGGQNCLTPEVGNPPSVRAVSITSATAMLSDMDGVINSTGSSAMTCTMPRDSSVPWKNGPHIVSLLQSGAGQCTFVAGSGVTITPASPKTRAQGSMIALVRTTPDTYAAIGDLA